VIKVTSRLEDADFLEFWFLGFQLDELYQKKCRKCENYCLCWSHEGTVYHPENVLKLCKNKQIRYVIKEPSKKDHLKHAATADEYLELKSKFKLSFLKKLKREGWTGKLPFYIVKCKKHNIYFLDYPQGFEGYFICPLCFEEALESSK